jgi:hypothetical protein
MLLKNEYRDGVGAHWTFLSDPGRKVQKDLDIVEYTDPEHVFWVTDHRRASARPACCAEEMPSGLGYP